MEKKTTFMYICNISCVTSGEGHKGEGDSSGHSTPRRDGKSSTTSTPRSASRNPPTPGDLSQVNMTASWNGSNSEGSAKGETENVNTTQGGIGYTVAFKPRGKARVCLRVCLWPLGLYRLCCMVPGLFLPLTPQCRSILLFY